MILRKTLHHIQKNQAQSLIELLIVVGVMAVLLPAVSMGLIASREGKPQQERRIHAAQLIKESQEALRSVREASWANIETNGTFYPEHDGSTWSLVAGTELINDITRQIEIEDVQRDDNNQIVVSGGSVDPSTKKITIITSWDAPIATSISSTLYLTRYLDNATYIQTTEDDFNTGTLSDVIVTNTGDGEVTLGSGGSGSWCSPSLTIASLDLPKSGVANAVTAIEGTAFAVTGNNASGVSFAEIDISNSSPPVATIESTFDGYKTNDVFGISGYAFLATDTNSKEIIILDISGATPTEVGHFDASGSSDGTSIFVSGTKGYMIQSATLRIFDLTSMSGSRPVLGSVSLAGEGRAVYVSGSYAYVAVKEADKALQIIDVSNPSSPSIVGWADLDGEGVSDVIINETATRAYISTDASSARKEAYIVDISTKIGQRPQIGSVNTDPMSPRGLTIVPGNKLIIVGINGEEYQVFDISNESAPTYCGGIDVPSGIKGIASILESDGDAYSYIITGDTSDEFKIIEGGPGGTYSSSGTYESATFDVGYSTAFNRVVPSFLQPANTTVQLQIAVADALAGSCTGATYEFVGPDGTTGSYYTEEDNIAFNNNGVNYENPARCFRYKVYLSTVDSSSTPIFEEISVNYSP